MWSDAVEKHLLLLYNCYVKDDDIRLKEARVGWKMPWALNLDQHAYPAFLNDLTLLSMREVGVPIKAGYGVGERVPAVATHVLALCEGPLSITVGRPILCCPEMRETCVFH